MNSHWFNRTRELTLQLVRFPSLTGTDGETNCAQHIHTLLAALPYFQTHKDHLRVVRTLDDTHERSMVLAFVRGNGPRTALLTGHFDVVSVDNFGELAPLAFEPEQLLPKLITQLRQNPNAANAKALQDFESGDYLPGRGALDMKSGLAAGMAVLEQFAALPDREGNLLFAAVPDEEATSQGMRALVRLLPQLTAEWDVSFEAAINLDSGVNLGSGPDGSEDGRAVFLGSVGKLLPSVFFVGRPTHAGAPFDGVNAALLAAELTRLVECNPEAGDLCEAPTPRRRRRALPRRNRGGVASDARGGGEPAPPPVALYQTDRRTRYDVTTPATAWCAFNVLTHWRTPRMIVDSFVQLTKQAMHNALDLLSERAQRYAHGLGMAVPERHWQPHVMTYAELKAQVGEARTMQIAQSLARDPDTDNISLSQRMIEALVREANVEGPAAVVCIASLYYPKVALGNAPRDARLREIVEAEAAQLARECGMGIGLRPFFSGISDMSFVSSHDDADSINVVTENTPPWGTRLTFDYSIAATLDLPIVNIGPWGQDYHQKTERVHMPYSFGVVPELIWRVVLHVTANHKPGFLKKPGL